MPICARRIRVLQMIPYLPLAGAERMVVNLAIGLDLEQHDVHVLTLNPPPSNTELYQILDAHHIPWSCLDRKFKFDARVIAKISRFIADFQPDVIHSHLSALQFAVLATIRHRPRAFVHTPHSIAPNNASWFGHIVGRMTFKRMIQTVAIAKEVQQSLVDFYKIPAPPIIHNGVDIDAYKIELAAGLQWREQAGFSPDDFLVVCVAGFRPVKNHSLLLNSFADGFAGDKKKHLLLVGDGLLRPEIEEQIANLNLQAQVHLLGWRSDVAAILSASDLFALASSWEGHSIAIMEAMAAGLPVLTTQVGGNLTLIQHERSGLLVPANDQQAFTQALFILSKNADLRRTFGQSGRQRVEADFSLETMARDYAQLYQNLLANGCADV